MIKILKIFILLLLLTSCASRAAVVKDMEAWQKWLDWPHIKCVEYNPDAEAWYQKTHAKDFVWTDEETIKLIDYLDKKTHYAVFLTPCGRIGYCCSPAEMSRCNYTGHCISLATYFYAFFYYVGYPREARIRLVDMFGFLGHALFIVEMEDGNWLEYNTYRRWGLERFDEVFYVLQFECDTQNIYYPNDLRRTQKLKRY